MRVKYAGELAASKVCQSSASAFSTSLTLTRCLKRYTLFFFDEILLAKNRYNVGGVLGIVPPSRFFATTNMCRTHRFPRLSRGHHSIGQEI